MFRIQRKPFTLVILNGQTAITSAAKLNLNGLLRGVIVNAPDLTSTHTYTIVIKDADGQTIFSQAGLTENVITSFFVDGNNYPLMVPLNGGEKITITASGTEGADRTFVTTLLVDTGA